MNSRAALRHTLMSATVSSARARAACVAAGDALRVAANFPAFSSLCTLFTDFHLPRFCAAMRLRSPFVTSIEGPQCRAGYGT